MKTCKAYLSLFIFLCAVVARGDDIRQYSYDAKGRLSAVTVLSDASKNESYKYDSRGNVVEQTVGSATYQFSYDKANQLTSRLGPDGLRHYTYDRAGRLIAENLNGKVAAKYTYGYLDKVTSVERDGQIIQFRYNADGMLMEKEYPDGRVEKWGWDGMALISRGDERYVNEPHMSGGVPLMSYSETRGVRYHINDYLGTTLLSLDAQGNVSDTYEDTTAFGQGASLQNDPAARFTGKPYDKDLGAFVFPFRNYNPENARWTTVDPSGFPDGPNAHFYAANPMTEIDPLGLVTVPGSIYANHSVNVMVEDNYISVYGNHSATFNFVYSFDSEGHLSPNSGYQNLSAIPWPTTAIHSYGLGSEGYGYTSTYTITVEVNNQYGVHAFDEWYQDIYQVTARMSLTVVYFKVDENGGHYGHQTILYLADCGPYSGNYSLRIEGSLYEE